MKYEKISKNAVLMWEILTAFICALAVFLVIQIFVPGTWLWYAILWCIGAIYILFAFLYFPLLYLNIEYAIFKNVIIYRHGIIFKKSDFLYRDRISYVTVFDNPLTPILHVSTVCISGAGGMLRIPFVRTDKAKQIARVLIRDKEDKA